MGVAENQSDAERHRDRAADAAIALLDRFGELLRGGDLDGKKATHDGASSWGTGGLGGM
jgi:hypothetical protein